MARSFNFLLVLTLFFMGAAHADVVESGGFSYQTEIAPDWVVQEDFPKTWPKDFASKDPFRIWRLDDQVQDTWGGYTDYAWQATTSSAVESAAQYSIDFDPSWQTLIVHELAVRRDDAWLTRLAPGVITLARREQQFEGMGYTGRVSALIVLPDIAVNDVIRIRYSLKGLHPLLKNIATANTFYLQHTQPMLQRRASVIGEDLRYELDPASANVTIKASPTRFFASVERMPAQVWVDQMPREMRPWPRVRVAPQADWKAVSTWANSLFDLDKLAPEVQALSAQIMVQAGKEPKQRALLALRHVQDKIRYFAVHLGESTHRPHPPKQVLALGYGDCKDKAQLLTILLRQMGIKAYPVLVNSERGAGIINELPNAGAFDHAIVMAEIGTKAYWLDATLTQQGGNLDTAKFPDYKYGLVLKSGNEHLTPMAPPATQNESIEVLEQFDASAVSASQNDGTALKVSTFWAGSGAEYMRAQRANTSDDKIADGYKQSYARSYGKVNLATLQFNDQRLSNILEATENYQLAQPWTAAGGYQFADFQAGTLARALELPADIERTQPLQQTLPLKLIHTIELTVPADAVNPEAPKDVEITDAAFRFSRISTLVPTSARPDNASQNDAKTGRTLKVRFEYESLSDLIKTNIGQHLANRRAAREALFIRLSFRPLDKAMDRKTRMRNLLEQLDTDARVSGAAK